MANPQSVDEWLDLARTHEAQARACARGNGLARAGVLSHVGFAAEAALKAAIMRREGLNRWPSRNDPGNYWTHDLRELRKKAGYAFTPSHEVGPAWAVVVQWDRQQDYSPKPTPIGVAKGYLDAAFGPDGLVTWIRAQLT